MANSFSVILPSNTKGYPNNRPNSFRVQLPKHIDLSSSNWLCGLHSITFQHIWPTIGTTDDQHLDVFLLKGGQIRAPIPKGAYHTQHELEQSLQDGVVAEFTRVLASYQNIDKKRRLKRKAEPSEAVTSNRGLQSDRGLTNSSGPKNSSDTTKMNLEEKKNAQKLLVEQQQGDIIQLDFDISSTAIDKKTLAQKARTRNRLGKKQSADKLLLLAYERAVEMFDVSSLRVNDARAVFTREQKQREDDIRLELKEIQEEMAAIADDEPLKAHLRLVRSIYGNALRTEQKTTADVLQRLSVSQTSQQAHIVQVHPSPENTQTVDDQRNRVTNAERMLADKEAEITAAASEDEKNRLRQESATIQRTLEAERKLLNELDNVSAEQPQSVDQVPTTRRPHTRVETPTTQETSSTTNETTIGDGTQKTQEPESTTNEPPTQKTSSETEKTHGVAGDSAPPPPPPPAGPKEDFANFLAQHKDEPKPEMEAPTHVGPVITIIPPPLQTRPVHDTEYSVMFEDGKIIIPYMTYEEIYAILRSVRFRYRQDISRFQLKIGSPLVDYVVPSPQLAYVLGYEEHQHIRNKDIAKYACDLKGGISHLCVYAHGLTENMIFGDTLSSLLRIVAINGNPGEVIEKVYDSPIFNKVLARDISEIAIEIRTMDGRLVPFDYGIVVVTLLFKKAIYF